jgi:hypothetical protein
VIALETEFEQANIRIIYVNEGRLSDKKGAQDGKRPSV